MSSWILLLWHITPLVSFKWTSIEYHLNQQRQIYSKHKKHANNRPAKDINYRESNIAMKWGYRTFPSSSRGALSSSSSKSSSVISTPNLKQRLAPVNQVVCLPLRDPQYQQHMAAINSVTTLPLAIKNAHVNIRG